MKKYIYVLCAAFALSGCAGSGYVSPEKVAVDSVYAYNMSVLDNSGSPSAVVAKLNSANLAGCPAPFAEAFGRYSAAWGGFAALERQMYEQDLKKADSTLANFISSYQNNQTRALVDLKAAWPEMASRIDAAGASLARAFAELKSAGARYNAVYAPKSWYEL